MGKRFPDGKMGELVGLNEGWNSSKTRPVRICGGTQTTVAVDDGGKRRVFMRSTWYERGSKGNYRPRLVGGAALELELAAEREGGLKRALLQTIRNRLDTLNSYARADYRIGVESLEDVLVEISELQKAVEEALPAIRTAASQTEESRKAVWG